MSLNNADFTTLAVAAFRYSLGRMTYMPSEVVRILEDNLDLVDQNTKELMIDEITRSHNRNELGMEMDKKTWLDFRRKLQLSQYTLDGKLSEVELELLSFFSIDYFYNYRYLENQTGKDRKELSPIIQKLRQLGFIMHSKGLWTEDGEMAGSGWCLSNEGWDYLKGLKNEVA